MRTSQGGFASALDADSEGEEGRVYAWTPGQLADALGPHDAEFAATVFMVTAEGTFEHGKSVLQYRGDEDVLEGPRGQRSAPAQAGQARAGQARAGQAHAERLRAIRSALFSARAARVLAELHMGATTQRPGKAPGQRGAARLARTSRDGVAGPSAGVLEDYGCTAEGFLALSAVTGEPRWVSLAGALLDSALGRFGDGRGGFYDTADDAERLLYRPQDPADNATPSGWFAVAHALLSYGALTGSQRHKAAAQAALSLVPTLASRFSRAAGWGMA